MSISNSETVVMQVIWSSNCELSSKEIVLLLSDKVDWSPKTIRTLLGRLVKKDFLGVVKKASSYSYFAKVSEDEFLADLSHGILDKFFGGALKPMLVHFADSKRISKTEADLLRKILDEDDRI
ncbi:penicillinase repressor [Lentisphaera araneosa HTCC2155]|uniref:Penicillinase repressor n=1 Tax=Lentisphaera araneosa HTCC2155 TaxID=313628 RepID=A6DQC3_9BACT|nr:BlaI/MecI/CopY family transcriptional regulator [Lentisphaera araneosa]EDM26174.1 penicillinase repressor [Lentisphaera araneosa HTCC2155]